MIHSKGTVDLSELPGAKHAFSGLFMSCFRLPFSSWTLTSRIVMASQGSR